MKAYKVFNSDWKCMDFQYKVGETYEMDDWKKILDNFLRFNEYDVPPETEDLTITDIKVIALLAYDKYIKEPNKCLIK